MTHLIIDQKTKINSKIAGFIYLLIAVVGGFSIGYVPAEIIVDTNPTQTFQNLEANFSLYQFGISGDITVLLLEMGLTFLLYRLFKSGRSISLKIATASRLAMAIIMGVNLIIYLAPGILLSFKEQMMGFTQNQIESLSLLFLKMHRYGELAWQVFFALHLLMLGIAVHNKIKLPKVLSVLIIIGGIGYGGDAIIQLLMIDKTILNSFFNFLLVMAVIGELWLAFWLIFRGPKRLALDED